MSIYSPVQTEKVPITLLLKGDSGTGKTWKAAHFPKPAIFNFDNNLSALRKLPTEVKSKIKIVNPHLKNEKPVAGVQVFDNFIKQLEQVAEDEDVQTIVIDSITTMAETLMDKVVGSDRPEKKVEIQHYGDYGRYLKWFGDTLMANPNLDKHIVVIAHEQTILDTKTQEVVRTLALVTKIKEQLPLYFSDVWRTYAQVLPNRVKWMVRTVPGSNFGCKCSIDLPSDFEWDTELANIQKQIAL